MVLWETKTVYSLASLWKTIRCICCKSGLVWNHMRVQKQMTFILVKYSFKKWPTQTVFRKTPKLFNVLIILMHLKKKPISIKIEGWWSWNGRLSHWAVPVEDGTLSVCQATLIFPSCNLPLLLIFNQCAPSVFQRGLRLSPQPFCDASRMDAPALCYSETREVQERGLSFVHGLPNNVSSYVCYHRATFLFEKLSR